MMYVTAISYCLDYRLFIPYICIPVCMLDIWIKIPLSMEAIPLTAIFLEFPAPRFWMRFEMDEGEYEYDLDADEVALVGTVAWSFRRMDREDVVRRWIAPMVVRFPWP